MSLFIKIWALVGFFGVYSSIWTSLLSFNNGCDAISTPMTEVAIMENRKYMITENDSICFENFLDFFNGVATLK